MKKAVLQTLAYADIFNWPMTEEEICRYLITPFKIENKTVLKTLQSLEKEKKIRKINSFYCLPQRKKIIALRKKREIYSKQKLKKARKIAHFLKFIPWIHLIGLTGAVACSNAKKDDDIDLFIITAKNRLWLTRGLIVVVLRFFGLYRRNSKIANMFCPNMLITEEALLIPKKEQNLFIAHEVYQMKPLWQKQPIYQKFLKENQWATKFLANWTI